MKLDAAIANAAWLLASLPEWGRYRHAAADVKAAQCRMLAGYLRNNANTDFGRAHGFHRIHDWQTYAERVPIRTYDEFDPWIERIAKGATGVLTAERVELLEPSSGSSGPAKWIPYTKTLQAEFRRAVAVWIAQNFIKRPALMGGRGYWSVTPQPPGQLTPTTQVPIGFDDDSAYLGGWTQRLLDLTLVTSPVLRRITDMETFWRVTLLLLLKCRDLRLISVWHPSYALLLLRHLRAGWARLIEDLKSGLELAAPPLRIDADPARARELASLGAAAPSAIWPALRLISCWGDANAEACLAEVRESFPNASVQPKGLIATEAFVSLALDEFRPLAVRSHFFEFLDDNGDLSPSWALARGAAYSVVITTGGGLYRYRLQDRVRVIGHFKGVPSLRFLGKEGNVSDFYGEKLAETFVAPVLEALFATHDLAPQFAMMAMDRSGEAPGYTLYIQCRGQCPERLVTDLETRLRRNPHYELCVRLGQLRPARVARIAADAYDIYSRTLTARGMRLGDIKPTPLSRFTDWSKHFAERILP